MFLSRDKEALLLVTDVLTEEFIHYVPFTKVFKNEICLNTFVNIPLLHDKDSVQIHKLLL